MISTFDGPSSRKFSFVINNAVVRRGQFVQLDSPDGKLIGRVSDVFKTNRYFMRPESVKEYESSGKPMGEIFPVDDWEYLVANVHTLGVYNNKTFQDCNLPPSPGTKVQEPDNGIIQDFFGLDPNGLYIGDLSSHNIQIKLNTTKLLQKHLAILALSGAGKSFLMSNIIEELLDRTPEKGQISVIVIDTHGEYTSFSDDQVYSNRTKVFSGSEIKIGLPNLSPYKLGDYVELTGPQIRELSKIIGGMKGAYGPGELYDTIEEKDINTNTKDILLSAIDELKSTGLFGASDFPSLGEISEAGKLTVIDLSDIINIKRKQIIVEYISRKLFNSRRNGIIPPFLLVLEEAHQYIPEKAKKGSAISKGIMQTIAREGRKFHTSLCLISQRPVQLSTTVLSQCNTHIILRVTNPYDLKHIGESSEGITKDVLDQISTLRVGNGLIVGEAVNFPLFVKIRNRTSKPSTKGLPLEEAAREYHNKVKQKIKDNKAFM